MSQFSRFQSVPGVVVHRDAISLQILVGLSISVRKRGKEEKGKGEKEKRGKEEKGKSRKGEKRIGEKKKRG